VTSGPPGEDSGADIQFVLGGATGVKFGVFNPDQYVVPRSTPGS